MIVKDQAEMFYLPRNASSTSIFRANKTFNELFNRFIEKSFRMRNRRLEIHGSLNLLGLILC